MRNNIHFVPEDCLINMHFIMQALFLQYKKYLYDITSNQLLTHLRNWIFCQSSWVKGIKSMVKVLELRTITVTSIRQCPYVMESFYRG